MRAFRTILMILGVAVLSWQCSQDPAVKIKKLEEKMGAKDFKFDEEGMKLANDLVQAYISYADTLKSNEKSPAYLFNAANLAMNLNQADKALELFNRIIYQYPNYEKAPDCLFLMGFITENQLQNYSKAIEIYQTFLSKYPDHDFADDARISIENMGKPLDELVKEFEAKNTQQ